MYHLTHIKKIGFRNKRYLMCFGSILSRNLVLTSATCIHDILYIKYVYLLIFFFILVLKYLPICALIVIFTYLDSPLFKYFLLSFIVQFKIRFCTFYLLSMYDTKNNFFFNILDFFYNSNLFLKSVKYNMQLNCYGIVNY